MDDLIEDRQLLIEELRDINEATQAATNPSQRRKLKKLWDEKLQLVALINKMSPRKNNKDQ